jgi:hypothetical protein
MEFNDRFGTTLTGVNLDTITDVQLSSISPVLYEMVTVIRGYSVLIRRKSIREIYEVIINQSDPRIALILAASRDNSGNQLFPTLTIVKTFMFGTVDDTVVKADVSFNEKSIFISGIRRVSCALSAAYLIGQLSQVPEQAQHSIILEKQAIDDLDRILKVPELKSAIQQAHNNEETKPRIYFEPTKINIGDRVLKVSVYLSTISSLWVDVNNYTNTINITNIIADISDYINEATLNSKTSNILASPVMSGILNLHYIEFDSRLRKVEINTELVSVKFSFTDSQGTFIELPFKWGLDNKNLLPYAVNSCLIQVDQSGNASAIESVNDEYKLDTIYFRTREVDDAGNEIIIADGTIDNLEYRISPTQVDSILLEVAYDSLEDRPNLMAVSLLNSLFEFKAETKVLGSIIQNDPVTVTTPMTGLQLVAWTITNKEVDLILDILDIPLDIEIALGNIKGPMTTFSNKPRSVRVKTQFERQSNILEEDMSNSSRVKLIRNRQSSLLTKLNDIRESDYKSYRRGMKYKDITHNIPNPYNIQY